MKTTFVALLTAIICGVSGYALGSYHGVLLMSRESSYATLNWLTAIDTKLQQGNIDSAKNLTFFATDATFGVLQTIESTPHHFFTTVLPWEAYNMKKFNDQIATRAKQHFAPRIEEFSEPSRNIIQHIVEVEIPKGSCSLKK